MVDGVIRKITSALLSARPQPQIIRGTIDGSRRGRTNMFTPRNQSESMQPNRTRKQTSISVPRSSRKCARPMTTTIPRPFFNIFHRGAKKSRRKANNEIKKQYIKHGTLYRRKKRKTLFSNSLKKEKNFEYSHIFFHFSSPKFAITMILDLRFFSGHKSWKSMN